MTDVTDLGARRVEQDLRDWAAGMYNLEAAVELLIRAFGGRFAKPSNAWIAYDSDTHRHWLEATAITTSTGPLSGGERRLLDVVASLATGTGVDLCDVATGLDRRHLSLVLAAIAHAGGSHEHSEVRADESTGPTSIAALPSLYPWPGP